jgi:pyruvate formate lyase activating enzyme
LHDRTGGTAFWPGCRKPLIERDWHDILFCRLADDGRCHDRATRIPGRFDRYAGSFGGRRMPVRMAARA